MVFLSSYFDDLVLEVFWYQGVIIIEIWYVYGAIILVYVQLFHVDVFCQLCLRDGRCGEGMFVECRLCF